MEKESARFLLRINSTQRASRYKTLLEVLGQDLREMMKSEISLLMVNGYTG